MNVLILININCNICICKKIKNIKFYLLNINKYKKIIKLINKILVIVFEMNLFG